MPSLEDGAVGNHCQPGKALPCPLLCTELRARPGFPLKSAFGAIPDEPLECGESCTRAVSGEPFLHRGGEHVERRAEDFFRSWKSWVLGRSQRLWKMPGDSNRKWDVYLSNGSCAGSPSKIPIENIHLIHEAIISTIISRAMSFVKPWRVFLTEMCQITQYLHFNHLRVKFHLLNLIKSMPFPHAHSLGSN